jgi:hypothetical protein
MKQTPRLLLAWFALVALACNLTSSEQPPTLVPQSLIGASPQPTIGYIPPPPGAADETAVATRPPADIALLILSDRVESDRLMLHVSTLVEFHTRHVNSSLTSTTQGIGAAYTHLQRQFETIRQDNPDFAVFSHPFQAFYNDVFSDQHNLVGYLPGTDPNAGVILVGAHYDSINSDFGDAVGASPGADDNASGVAAVIELARILSQRSHRSSIMFVLFSAEEVNRQGSLHFVKDMIIDKEVPLAAMINVDTIGSWNAPDGTIKDREIRVFSAGPNDSPSRQLARTVDFIANEYDSKLNVIVQDAIDRDNRYGDHWSFSEAGYPAVRFTEAVEDTWNRDSRDTAAGIEPVYLADATRTILSVVTALADGLAPTRNISLRNNGDGTQTLVWEPVVGATRYIVALRRPNSLTYAQQFVVLETTSGAWDGWSQFEAIAITALDANGLVGPFSAEYPIP